jgi:hypothetical protein
MRAQITLFGVTIAFVPADQDCRAERRLGVRSPWPSPSLSVMLPLDLA